MEADYRVVDTPEALPGLPRRLAPATEVLRRHRDDVDRPAAAPTSSAWPSAGRPGRPTTCRCGRPIGCRSLDESAVLEALRPILADPARREGRRRTSSTTCSCSTARGSIEAAGPLTDTMVLSYLLESGERNHNLDQLSQPAARPHHDPDHRPDRQGQEPVRMDQVAVAKVAGYAGEDADATWRIEAILHPRSAGGPLAAVRR